MWLVNGLTVPGLVPDANLRQLMTLSIVAEPPAIS